MCSNCVVSVFYVCCKRVVSVVVVLLCVAIVNDLYYIVSEPSEQCAVFGLMYCTILSEKTTSGNRCYTGRRCLITHHNE